MIGDDAVRKMHKYLATNLFRTIKSRIHEGWPEKLELPEWPAAGGDGVGGSEGSLAAVRLLPRPR